MTDLIIEILRAIVVGGIILSLVKMRSASTISTIRGWHTLMAGFAFIFFGTIIDITDNFEALNRYVIIGDTEVQAFLEKIIGYLLGFVLLAIGIKQWLPKLIDHIEMTQKMHEVEIEEERIKALRSTMVTVQNIVNNFLNNMQLFQIEAEASNALEPETLEQMNSIIMETAAKLKIIAELDSIPEKQLAVGVGIDYEKTAAAENPPASHLRR